MEAVDKKLKKVCLEIEKRYEIRFLGGDLKSMMNRGRGNDQEDKR
jgi:hypothetical protein